MRPRVPCHHPRARTRLAASLALPLLFLSAAVQATPLDGVWYPVPILAEPASLSSPAPASALAPSAPVVTSAMGGRFGHSMIFDPAGQRWLAFGGIKTGLVPGSDLWERAVGSTDERS